MKIRWLTILPFCGALIFAQGCQSNTEDEKSTAIELTGVIKYENGTPVVNQAIEAIGPVPLNVFTDAEGQFKIGESDGLVPGEYRFFIEEMDSTKLDNAVYEAMVTVKSGQKELVVVLKRKK